MTPERFCPVCASRTMEFFFTLNDIPIFCNVLHATRESAVAAKRGTLSLGICNACSHIFNYAFEPRMMHYSQAYENSLHFSPRFQAYAQQLAEELIERHDVRGKSIIELGCGKGDFLKLMCEVGNNRGLGFDASFQPELIERSERFIVIQDFYSEKYSHYPADFVVCRHVLEHIETPRTFVEQLHQTLAAKPDVVLYIEVPNALWTLRDFGVWDLIYEHCSYFTPDSLSHLFSSCGFEILRLEEKFRRQFLGIEIKPDGNGNRHPDGNGNRHAERSRSVTAQQLTPLIRSFSEHYRRKIEEWKNKFKRLEGKRIVVWGSGSKGVTFLNALTPKIEYVIDINPRKQGKFVAGTGQEIVAPEFLSGYKPDAIIVMNPNYEKEIRDVLSRMGIVAEVAPA